MRDRPFVDATDWLEANAQSCTDKHEASLRPRTSNVAPIKSVKRKGVGNSRGNVGAEPKNYADGIHHVNTVEGFWKLFKDSVKPTPIHISKKYATPTDSSTLVPNQYLSEQYCV